METAIYCGGTFLAFVTCGKNDRDIMLSMQKHAETGKRVSSRTQLKIEAEVMIWKDATNARKCCLKKRTAAWAAPTDVTSTIGGRLSIR